MPASIWALGLGSLFMDASSELVHSLLPVFMTSVLGVSIVTIGAVEGIAEATASMTKLFSGALSDRIGNRKGLVVLGYGLAALTKPVFPLATSVTWVLAGRFVDRVGKGIRGAPRDALVADITPARLRGAAYGLRQTLDSVGAFLGPLLAILLMRQFENDIRAVLWVAVLPASLAVGLLAVGVREPEPTSGRADEQSRVRLRDIARLPERYWLTVLLGVAVTLARFSEAFLVLRAQDIGLSIAYVPAVMIAMNVVYAGTAYPAGMAGDRVRPRTLLLAGLATLVAADVALIVATAPVHVFLGTALWGAHMGLTQGLLSKLVADAAPPALRGIGFGTFNVAMGAALLVASMIAGALWSAAGPGATFAAGASFATIAAIGLLVGMAPDHKDQEAGGPTDAG